MDIKVTKTVTVDFNGRLTMQGLRNFVDDTHDIPGTAVIDVNAGDSQMDGPWCIFTVVSDSQ